MFTKQILVKRLIENNFKPPHNRWESVGDDCRLHSCIRRGECNDYMCVSRAVLALSMCTPTIS